MYQKTCFTDFNKESTVAILHSYGNSTIRRESRRRPIILGRDLCVDIADWLKMARWWKIAVMVGILGILRGWSKHYGWDNEAAVRVLRDWSDRLGIWAIPLYVAIHTLSIALCLPSAVFFEAAGSLLFGFFPAVLCVFSAKVLGASLSFGIGRSANFFKFYFLLCSPFSKLLSFTTGV